jgi:hypothetical protein
MNAWADDRMGIAPFEVSKGLTEGERVVREKA